MSNDQRHSDGSTQRDASSQASRSSGGYRPYDSRYDSRYNTRYARRSQGDAHRVSGEQGNRRANPYNRYSAGNYRSASRDYSRGSSLSSSRGSAARAGGQRRSKKGLIIGIVALLIVIGAIYYYTNLAHIDIIVNGSQVSVAKNTTYAKLRDMSLIASDPGDFIAVDGTILEEDAGQPTKLFDNDVEVSDYNARVSESSVITQARGDDIMEEYDSTQTTIPITFQINDGDFNFYQGPLHTIVSYGKEGIAESRTGKTSGITVSDEIVEPMEPKIMKSIDPETTESSDSGDTGDSSDTGESGDTGNSTDKVIALTFDDGPWKDNTQDILDILEDNGAKATFFMVGEMVEEYPELAKAVADGGHQVASHTYSHNYLNQLDEAGIIEELSKGQEAIYSATGITTTTVRPPGGNVDYDDVVIGEQYITSLVGWTIDSEDWQKPGADAIASTILSGACDGAIILCHDGGGDRSQTVEAMKTVIPQLLEEGYRFVTIDELVELKAAAYQDDTMNSTGDEDASSADGEATGESTE